MENWIIYKLIKIGIDPTFSIYLAKSILVIIAIFISWLVNFIIKYFFHKIIKKIINKTSTKWDDIIWEKGVIKRISRIFPALVIYFAVSLVFPGTTFEIFIKRIASAYLILIIIFVINSFLDAINYIYSTYQIAKVRPIKGYIQLVKMLVFIVGIIIVIGTLIDKSPWGIIAGLGAMTAILLLIFKDSILGFVASIQLNSNQLIRIGDWITIPSADIDGDVIDISLHTVQIQNFDRTISSIPSYTLITTPFKNWRGMQESGVRRIKRAINIDMQSIKFCTNEMLEKFKRIQLISEYIKNKQDEILVYNTENNIDNSAFANGRNLTNIGTFRAYISEFIKNHQKISKNDLILIRQLAPTEYGLPIEIYAFTNDSAWASHENIQSDIFDHILSVVPEFDLRIFQSPTGGDIKNLLSGNSVNK